MKVPIVFLMALLLVPYTTNAKGFNSNKYQVGVETDSYYYLAGGYHGSLWIGRNDYRIRVSGAQYDLPEFLLGSGLDSEDAFGYGVYFGFFPIKDTREVTFEFGVENWDGNLVLKDDAGTEKRTSTVAVINIGFLWKFYRRLYIHPNIILNWNIQSELESGHVTDPGYDSLRNGGMYPGFSLVFGGQIF